LDALHTQRWEAEPILASQGHYLMVVKPNQHTLYQDIQWAFEALPPLNRDEQAYWAYQRNETHERSHGCGRVERRTLESTTRLNDYLTWPGVAQIMCKILCASWMLSQHEIALRGGAPPAGAPP
jgi:hypothetical protein